MVNTVITGRKIKACRYSVSFVHGISSRIIECSMTLLPLKIEPLAAFAGVEISKNFFEVSLMDMAVHSLSNNVHRCLIGDFVFNAEQCVWTKNSGLLWYE